MLRLADSKARSVVHCPFDASDDVFLTDKLAVKNAYVLHLFQIQEGIFYYIFKLCDAFYVPVNHS